VQPNPDQRRRRPLQAWTCGGERATKTDRAVLGMGAMTAAGVVWARNHVRAIALALAVAVAAPAFAAESPPNPDTPPVAVAARIEQSDGAARLTFDLSRFVEAHAFQLADPDRIIIDVPEVNFQIDPAVGRAAADTRAGSLIKSFRFGLLAPGKSRIVIDLASPARIDRVSTKAIAAGADPARLQIELSRCNPAEFREAARQAGQGSAAAETAETPVRQASRPVIVLDPGHGGVDGGALGPQGAVEKTIVFDFAQELARQLRATDRYDVVMTRDGDTFVSLDDRVRIARRAGAALLISIHADTLTEAAGVSGATVYTVADRASDAEAARVAEHENSADKAAGVEASPDKAGVADILFDLRRRETRAYAHLFSRGLVDQWRTAGTLNHRPERSARFVVLKAPDFPSVLLELGYLSSSQDVKALTSPEWRTKASAAIETAVDRFFSPESASAAVSPTQAVAPASFMPDAPQGPQVSQSRDASRTQQGGDDDRR
jgi:N-acetylmuramoyl-L-alanine amidase